MIDGGSQCPLPFTADSGTLLYSRQFVGAATTVAVSNSGCLLQVVRADPAGLLMLRTLPIDNSLVSGETQVDSSAPTFALAARNGVVAIAHGSTLRFFPAGAGSPSQVVPLPVGTTAGAVALFRSGSVIQAMVHGSSSGNDYAWAIANSSIGVLDAGTSVCDQVTVTRAAVLSSEEQVFSASRAVTNSGCTIINRTDSLSGRNSVRAYVSGGASGVLLQNTGSAGGSTPKTLVGALGMEAIFGVGGNSINNMILTRHDLASGFTTGAQIAYLNNANAVELLVGPGGVAYVVGTTRAGGDAGANLGNSTFVMNDGGGADPFVAKFTGNTVTWIRNLGGPADETATHAVLADDQLVVVGTCGSAAGSALCNGVGTHWVVSLKP